MGLPEEQCEPRDDVVPCWACRTPVVVPVADSQPVPVYAVPPFRHLLCMQQHLRPCAVHVTNQGLHASGGAG